MREKSYKKALRKLLKSQEVQASKDDLVMEITFVFTRDDKERFEKVGRGLGLDFESEPHKVLLSMLKRCEPESES